MRRGADPGRMLTPWPVIPRKILVQVPAERSPDGVVIANPLRLLLLRIAFEAKTTELDHDLVGSKRSRYL